MLYIEDFDDIEGEWICIDKGKKSKFKGKIIAVGENIEDGFESIKSKGMILEPIPDTKKREVLYIAGPSGSGKSSYASKYMENYVKMFPDNHIYIFSREMDDPVISKLVKSYESIHFVIINEDIYNTPIDITSEMKNCLVFFDDCDTIPDAKIKKAIDKLKNDIMEVGRKRFISIVITSHLINKGVETKTVLNESQYITLYPKSSSTYQCKYVLDKYIGLNRKQIDCLMKIQSRWITLKRTYPQVCFHENGCFMLNKL